jgi:serine/threonine protein kinase
MIKRMGTIIYMAPELYARKQYSKRVDTWALGLIMYILLEGRHPLYREGKDNEKSFAAKLNNPVWKFTDRTSPIARNLF